MNDSATFVFQGTVTRIAQSTVAGLEVPGTTSGELLAVVRVERALRVTPELATLVGDEVTVALAAPAPVGETAVFSTVGWVYGAAVAVVELEREAPTAEMASVTPTQQLEVAWMAATSGRVTQSVQVLSGRVEGLQPHPAASPRFSEHDPDWWLADVAVATVLKGSRSRLVQVAFANSRDAMWYRSPKLTPSQSSVFILHRDPERLPDRRSRGVLHVLDVHPLDKVEVIAAMV